MLRDTRLNEAKHVSVVTELWNWSHGLDDNKISRWLKNLKNSNKIQNLRSNWITENRC